jgi:hypothetical protein
MIESVGGNAWQCIDHCQLKEALSTGISAWQSIRRITTTHSTIICEDIFSDATPYLLEPTLAASLLEPALAGRRPTRGIPRCNRIVQPPSRDAGSTLNQ